MLRIFGNLDIRKHKSQDEKNFDNDRDKVIDQNKRKTLAFERNKLKYLILQYLIKEKRTHIDKGFDTKTEFTKKRMALVSDQNDKNAGFKTKTGTMNHKTRNQREQNY